MDLQDIYDGIAFKNNQNLRPTNISIPYTQDQILEITKCARDPVYFVKNFVKIVHVDRGFVPFELYEFQEKMIRLYSENRKVLGLWPRQYGKTQTTAAYVLWYILFNDEKTVAILANKALIANEILNRIKQAYEALPMFLQQGIVTWNKGRIELENKSRIIAAATSSSAIRGMSISCVSGDTKITVRNKKTGKIHETSIGEFAIMINNKQANSPRINHDREDFAEIQFS